MDSLLFLDLLNNFVPMKYITISTIPHKNNPKYIAS